MFAADNVGEAIFALVHLHTCLQLTEAHERWLILATNKNLDINKTRL